MIKEKENTQLHLKYKRRHNYRDNDCNLFLLFLFNPVTKVIILSTNPEKLTLVFKPLTLSNRRSGLLLIGDTEGMNQV